MSNTRWGTCVECGTPLYRHNRNDVTCTNTHPKKKAKK